jgi:hypothetical protein
VVEEFGPLADLWLRPEVVDRSWAWRGEMNGEPVVAPAAASPTLARGQCGLLLVTAHAASFPRLRPAFVLPVEWRREARASPLLPDGLAGFSAAVLGDLGLGDLGLGGLSLHLPDWLTSRGVDLSGLRFAYDSAWASLAAGAIVADQGGATLPDVMASAAWNHEQPTRGWFKRIEGLADKLDAAVAAGARVVFAPRENLTDVEAWRAARPDVTLDIQLLSNATDVPAKALAPVLVALEAMPTLKTGADFEQRSRYYVRLPPSAKDRYHRDELLEDLVGRLRPQVEAAWAFPASDRLALVVSKSWSLALLVVRLFDPAHVLLLHDGKLNDVLGILEAELPVNGRAGRARRTVTAAECRPGGTFVGDIRAAVMRFAAGAPSVVVDATAGYKDFQFSILSNLPANALAMYIATDQDLLHASAVPGTERVRVLSIPSPPGRPVAPQAKTQA